MGKNNKKKRWYTLGQPHLTRRRGKARNWRGWLGGTEVSLGTPDRSEALRRLQELAAERRRPATKAAPPKELALAELAARFIEFGQPPRFTRSTIHTYGARIVTFIAWAEAHQLRLPSEVDQGVLQKFMRDRADKDGVGGRTINRDFTALNAMFRYGAANHFTPTNPFADGGLKRLKLREPQPKPQALTLSPTQVDEFLEHADKISHSAYAALFRGTAGSAARIDEMLHLELWEIDRARGVLTISPKKGWTTKGYRFREVPISEATGKALSEFVAQRNEVRVDQKAIWSELQRIRKGAGLPHFSMHDLRRAWASAVHHNGASLKQVSVWLGHKEVQTTERYIRVFLDVTEGHQFLPR